MPIVERSIPKSISEAEYRMPERVVSRLGRLDNGADINAAVDLLKQGDVIGFKIYGVYGIMANAADERAIEKIHTIKETPSSKPSVLTTMVDMRILAPYIDKNEVHESIKPFLEDINKLRRRTAALCHWRFPLLDSAIEQNILPSSIHQDGIVQNLDPMGHFLMEPLILRAHENDIHYVAVTSLNKSRVMAEIVDEDTALEFSENNGIKMLLNDPSFREPSIQGSFSILNAKTLEAHREGFVPVWVLEMILGLHNNPEGMRINTENMKPAKYDHADFSHLRALQDNPEAIRHAILCYINGREFNPSDHSNKFLYNNATPLFTYSL